MAVEDRVGWRRACTATGKDRENREDRRDRLTEKSSEGRNETNYFRSKSIIDSQPVSSRLLKGCRGWQLLDIWRLVFGLFRWSRTDEAE